MNRYDLLIENGTVIYPGGRRNLDIAIKDGKIAALFERKSISENNSELLPVAESSLRIDARERFILPGLIDPHVHFHLPVGSYFSSDDFNSGGMAALSGGITTVIDFTSRMPGESLSESVKRRIEEAEGQGPTCDYGLHVVLALMDDDDYGEIEKLVEEGFPSFKMFMAYRSRGLGSSDERIYRALEKARDAGGIVGVHAENGDVIDYLVECARAGGRISAVEHYYSRPQWVEEEAISRAAYLAYGARSSIYIFHMSVAGGMEICSKFRQMGVDIHIETCPHYLFLTRKRYESADGMNFILSPSLKEERDREALWYGIRTGIISTVGTDHCPFMRREKEGKKFNEVPGGIGSIEFSFRLLATVALGIDPVTGEKLAEQESERGTLPEKIDFERIVSLMSENPAKIFGLYPRKGVIQPGADADLVIFNPSGRSTGGSVPQMSRGDFNPFAGYTFAGTIEKTILRGKIVFEDGKYRGKSGDGCLIRRERYRRN